MYSFYSSPLDPRVVIPLHRNTIVFVPPLYSWVVSNGPYDTRKVNLYNTGYSTATYPSSILPFYFLPRTHQPSVNSNDKALQLGRVIHAASPSDCSRIMKPITLRWVVNMRSWESEIISDLPLARNAVLRYHSL